MTHMIPLMTYLRRMNITTRKVDRKTGTVTREDGVVWVFWTYRNKVPNIIIAEDRDRAKDLVRRLNPTACFFR